jgi:peptide/nickel transport system permease protein
VTDPGLVHPAPTAARLRPSRGGALLASAARWALSHKFVALALLFWGLALFAACFPSVLTGGDPSAQDLAATMQPPRSDQHLFGTDHLGRDVFTRVVHGARTSIVVGLGAVAIGGAIGMCLGLVGGYFRRARGVVDVLIDIKMAFPGLVLILTIVVFIGEQDLLVLAAILGFTGWSRYARVVRGLVLPMREREFVLGARASGAGSARIMVAHLIPNVAGPFTVIAVLDLSRAILAESSISFLGLGLQDPVVSWGLMLAQGRDYMGTAWWLVIIPGVALTALVLATTIIANELQNRIDPLRRMVR